MGRATGANWIDTTEGEVVVTLVRGSDPQAFGRAYGATLTEITDWGAYSYLPGGTETPDQLMARVKLDPQVITSERNGYYETAESRQQSLAFDDGFGSALVCAKQPAMESLGLAAALVVSRGAGVRVAILDTGAELTHPEFAGRVVGGRDFIDGDDNPTDVPDGIDNNHNGLIDEALGHGTHVAGIVARTAPEASLLIVRVLDADGRGDVMGVASGIRWAMDHGARVINLSLGMLTRSELIEDLLEEADRRGIACVAAAGNRGSDTPQEYPATSAHALAVAALDASGKAATFTSRGSFVALSAPGVDIRSAYYGGRYALWSGTSMSAPFVSGAAALLLAIHPEWDRTAILARLGATARVIDALNPNMVGELGAGGLLLGMALVPDAIIWSTHRTPIHPIIPIE